VKQSSQIILSVMVIFLALVSCARIAKHQPETNCDLHDVRLRKNTVKLVYGLPPRLSEGYREASKSEFPHSFLHANGGCVVNPFIRWARVKSCPVCNDAERRWLEANLKYEYQEKESTEAADEPVAAVSDKQ
jgi:hypothetical protein